MADDVQSNIKVNIDTSSALASIKNLQTQISAFHTSMAKSGAAANAAATQMQQTLINSVNATGKFSASMQTIKTTTESFTNSLEKNKLSMGEYFRYAGASTKTFGRLFKSEFETINKVARERVKDLQTQYVKMGRDANGAMKAIAIRPLMLDMDNLATKTQIAAQRQQLLNQLLKQGSTNLLNFGKNTQWAGRQLMVGFSIPLAMAGTAAAKAYMQIEKASINIRRVYGDLSTTAKETNAMVAQIKNLASEYTKYGVAVADTMDMAAKAAAMGKTGADLLAQINNATKLSVLGGVDQNTALDTTISLTNAFGTSTSQLTDKINFLNSVENQTVLNIEDMTTAIPKAAPVVRQLGGDVEDLAFFLTAMKEGGINASEGANALKSGLSSLINPSKKASEFLMGFGVNVRQIVQNDKGNLKKTVVDFAEALNKINPLDRARAIEQMFGKFQFARISTLLNNVTKEGSQASKALALANMTSIQRAALARQELAKLEASPMYKFQKAIADLQTRIAPIGEQFLKAVTPIVSKVSDILGGFNKMGDGFKNFAVIGGAVVGGLAPVLLMVFGLIANGAANIIKLFANIKSFFNGASSASTILGEQTNYLTTEQLKAEAVAASLDQVHGKLTQTFTSETFAIGQLAAALERAALAQNAFSGFRPTSGPAPTKRATGGMIQGPGTGTSDSIPAMVSTGEFIMPAKQTKKYLPFLQNMVMGKIPGFNGENGNIVGGSIARAHASMPFEQGSSTWQSGVKLAGLEKLAQEFPSFIKVVSNLVVELPQKLNMGLIRGTSQEKFSAGWSSRTDKLKLSAMLGGADMKDSANIEAGRLLEKEIHDRTIEMAKATADQKVNDDLLAKATREVIEKYKAESTAIGKVASALDISSAQVGQVRVQAPTADVREGLKNGSLSMGTSGKVMYGDTPIARQSQSNKNKFRPASSYNIGKNYTRVTLEGFNAGLADAAQTASPSRRTKKVAKDTVDGYVIGLQEGQKEVAQSGARIPRRASQNQTNYDLLNLPMYGPAKPTRMQSLQSKAMGLKNKTVGDVAAGPLAGLGAAASMATFALSGMPGPIGQIAGTIAPVVSIFSVISPLLATFGASLGIAELPLLPVAAGLAGIAAVVGVSIAVTNAINDAKKKELEQINATSDAYKNARGSFKELAGLSGVTPKTSLSDVSRNYYSANANASNVNDISTLLASNEFKDKGTSTNKMIQNIKSMSNVQAKSFLQSFGQSLISSGMDKKSVDSTIKALQAAAGKKDLKLSFKSIDLNNEKNQKSVLDSLNKTTAELTKAGSKFAKMPTGAYFGKEQEIAKYRNAYKTFANTVSTSLKGVADQFAQGSLTGKAYHTVVSGINKQILGIGDSATRARVLKTLFADFGPSAQAAVSSVSDVNQQLKMYQILVLGGADALTNMMNKVPATIKHAGAAATSAFLSAHPELMNGTLADVEKSAKAIQKIMNSVSGTGTSSGTSKTVKSLSDLIKEAKAANVVIAEQEKAFKKLTAAGISAAEATKMITDADFAHQIAQSKNKKGVSELIALKRRQLVLEKELKDITDPEQSKIDAANKKIAVLEAENKISQLGLDRISKQEDAINKKYDERIAALDKIQQANKEIAAQQQDQLDLSSALAKGDMAAAARATQKLRASAAEKAMADQKTALENSRTAALAGVTTQVGGATMNRKQLEDVMATRNDQINTIETNEVAPNELALAKKETAPAVSDDLYNKNIMPVATPASGKEWKWSTAWNHWMQVKKTSSSASAKTSTAPAAKKLTLAQISAMPLSKFKTVKKSMGGLIPKYFASGGFAMGTDTVPAMLTPGEYVIKKSAVDNFGIKNLNSINNGASAGNSVYNNYTISVNAGTNASADDIARVVMSKIKQVDSQRLRGNTF